MSIKKCVVLFSGNGSNLENLLKKRHLIKDKLKYICAFTNNEKAKGIKICKNFNIKVCIGGKDTLNQSLKYFLIETNPDLIILSGYMKIIPEFIVNDYLGKIINIHPSLLPKYPGLKTYDKVIKNQDTEHGATIHFVTKDLDEGPIILQGSFPVGEDITKKELEYRTHETEYEIFPIVIKWFAENIVKYEDSKVYINDKHIKEPVIYLMNERDE